MDVIVRTVIKGLLPFILLFGVAVMFHGHLTPGGSFPGGAIVASGFALAALAFGLDEAEGKMDEKKVHLLEAAAALVVAFVIINEAFVRGYSGVFGVFGVWSSVDVMVLNVAGGVMVLGALTLAVFLLLRE
jgi:multisubunit Na+/H+ antiporter MnhB subunit